MTAAAIPYEEIDVEIRPLVALMNRLPGISTLHSCIGHKDNEEGYVSFAAESQEALKDFMSCLPDQGGRMSINFCDGDESFRWMRALVRVHLYEDRLTYRLSLRGDPIFMQRQLVESIEKALRERLKG